MQRLSIAAVPAAVVLLLLSTVIPNAWLAGLAIIVLAHIPGLLGYD